MIQSDMIGDWYVVSGGVRLRGPYTHQETAAAVRDEMERYRHWERFYLNVYQCDDAEPRQHPETD